MKKLFTVILASVLSCSVYAQWASDALMIAQNEYEGSARTIAMGNAFTALGGDLGAITINPASSGLYWYTAFGISPEVISSGTQTTYLGTPFNDYDVRGALSNVGFVLPIYQNSHGKPFQINFGFTMNRIKSFDTSISAQGTTANASMLGSIAASLENVPPADLAADGTYDPYYDSYLPWLGILAWDTYGINPRTDVDNHSYLAATEYIGNDGYPHSAGSLYNYFESRATGGIRETSINMGLNFGDRLFLGVNANIHNVNYSLEEYFNEVRVGQPKVDNGFSSMTANYWQITEGSGFNLKIGAIYALSERLRLGATLTTPTWYSLTDSWQRDMFTVADGNSVSSQTPLGTSTYQVNAPGRFSVGAAYVGRSSIFSLDYEHVDYSTMTMADIDGRPADFADANDAISNGLVSAGIIRAGGEYWLGNTAFRAGYTLYTDPGMLNGYSYAERDYVSCGLGFLLGDSITLDFGYQGLLSANGYSFSCYDDYDDIEAPLISVDRERYHKFVFSFGFRF